jgi:hypothetical protein
MKLEQKLLEEVKRFRAIHAYGKKMIMEQDPAAAAPMPPAPDAGAMPPPADMGAMPPDAGAMPPAPAGGMPPDAGAPADTEEVDVTDLVNMTKNIKKEIDKKQLENNDVLTKMDDVFTKLNDLESKLSQMDSMLAKIDALGSKVESMKEPSAVEKLEMRSLDSYPFSQNPQQFFNHKQAEMKATGKNEYVLTKSEIENYSKDEIRDTFNPELEDETGF